MESGAAETSLACEKPAQPVPLACEEIVNLYLRDVDRSLISENLSYIGRLQRLQRNVQAANGIRGAGVQALKRQE